MLELQRSETLTPHPAIVLAGENLTSGETTWAAEPHVGETAFSGAGARWGMDYMHARYYKPIWGRFLSVDPARASQSPRNPQSWNRYVYTLGNPLTRVDRNGQWSTPIHNEILANSFPSLSKAQLQILQKASKAADGPVNQLESRSFIHAMRAPNQSVQDAQAKSAAFYASNISAAKSAQATWVAAGNSGLSPDALQKVGTAIHTATDGTSPSHAGAQVWSPITDLIAGGKSTGLTMSISGILSHSAGESAISPDQMNAAVAAAQAAFAEAFGADAAQAASCPEVGPCARQAQEK